MREADLVFPSPSLPSAIIIHKGKLVIRRLKRLKHTARREFGLARVIHEGQEKPSFEIDTEKLQEQSGAAVTGLDRGRLHDGLESMIEDYLEQDDISKMYGKSDASVETHRLRDALVRFAQKMLFVANYDNLMSRDNRKRSYEYVLDYTVGFLTEPLFKYDEKNR